MYHQDTVADTILYLEDKDTVEDCILQIITPARHRDSAGGLMYCRCYFLLLNVAPVIRQRVDGSQRGLLR